MMWWLKGWSLGYCLNVVFLFFLSEIIIFECLNWLFWSSVIVIFFKLFICKCWIKCIIFMIFFF